MSPASAGFNIDNAYPQLALWATDMPASFAGFKYFTTPA
jgi:hypothetical protein